jgi:hypothetical protein
MIIGNSHSEPAGNRSSSGLKRLKLFLQRGHIRTSGFLGVQTCPQKGHLSRGRTILITQHALMPINKLYGRFPTLLSSEIF